MQLKSTGDKKLRLAVLLADDYLNANCCSTQPALSAAPTVDSVEEVFAVPSCSRSTFARELPVRPSKSDEQ
ncbi:unnamed protein product [Sphagnum balticum]